MPACLPRVRVSLCFSSPPHMHSDSPSLCPRLTPRLPSFCCMATQCAHLAPATDHVRLQGKAFSQWEHFAVDRKRVKAKAYRVIIKIKGSSAARAWGTWSQAVEGSRRAGQYQQREAWVSLLRHCSRSARAAGWIEGEGACAWERLG